MSEKHLEELIRQDFVGQPKERVSHRLNYVFMLKSRQYKARQNSFGGFFSWIFSMNGLGIKTAVASLLLAFILIKPDLNSPSNVAIGIDSTSVNQSLVLDSTLYQTDSKTSTDRIF